jgi:DNA-binding response OmpR family regulator
MKSDEVLGPELGGDDCVTKPFGTQELAARVPRSFLMDAVASARATMEAAAVDILGAEAATRLEELLDTHRVEQAEKKLATLGERSGDRVEFLTRVWALNDDQVGLLRSILDETQTEIFDQLEEMRPPRGHAFHGPNGPRARRG